MEKNKLKDPEYWASQLWMYFKPLILSGSPFYLSVDKRLLNHLLGVSYDEVKHFESNVNYFHEACSNLFVAKGSRLSVCPHAFKQIDGKVFSSVICLAAQQVLVVEEMYRDGFYSGHSYFPRYRKILNFEKGNPNSNPLLSSDFLKIWSKLKEEISSMSSSNVVTFAKGLNRRDVNRNFPLSQALLTTQDLIKLKRKSGFFKVDDDEAMLNFLLRKRNILGQRGRSVILRAGAQKKKRLVEQFRSFLALDYDYEMLEKDLLSKGRREILVAFIDRRSRLFSDSLSFAIWNGEDSFEKGNELKSILQKRLYNSEILMIADNRKYVEMKSDLVMNHSNTVLVVVHKDKEEVWKGRLTLNQSFYDDKVEKISSNISEYASCFLIDRVTERELYKLFGNIVSPKSLSLVGGVPVDARENIYLKGYCPTGISLNDTELKKSDIINVNGDDCSVGEFFERLNHVERHSFEVTKCGRKIGFSILTRQVTEESREYGYSIEDGKLSPFADLIEPDIPALVGPLIRYDQFLESNLSEITLPILVSILDSTENDEELDHSEVEALIRFLERVNINSNLKKFAIQKVTRFKKIRSNPSIFNYLGRSA